jgi:hypothetical protein
MVRVVISAVVMTGAVVTERAHAQPGDAGATAEQLLEQARDLAKANRWAEACPKFEESLRAAPVLDTRFELAACDEHIGKLASAWSLFREAIQLATNPDDVARRDDAQKHVDALEPRLPKLRIPVPENPPAGLVVARDGAPVDVNALGVAVYVDPGAHTITASAPGFVAFTKTVTLVEGKEETLTIPALVRPPPPPPPELPIRKYLALGTGAAGVAIIGVGLVFGAKAMSAYHDAQALCGPNLLCSTDNVSQGQQDIRDTRSNATTSTVLVIAGSAAVVAGAVVFLLDRRSHEHATAQIVPVTYGRGSGLAVTGRF